MIGSELYGLRLRQVAQKQPFGAVFQTADKASKYLEALFFIMQSCSDLPVQTELEMVTLAQLVPKGHLLRLIDQHIRFEFIRTETESQSLYCASNGRPAIDPVVLFKMLFRLPVRDSVRA